MDIPQLCACRSAAPLALRIRSSALSRPCRPPSASAPSNPSGRSGGIASLGQDKTVPGCIASLGQDKTVPGCIASLGHDKTVPGSFLKSSLLSGPHCGGNRHNSTLGRTECGSHSSRSAVVMASKAAKKSAPSKKVPARETKAAELASSGVSIEESREPNSRLRLTVTVPEELCKMVWDTSVREMSKQAQINGFRKGDRIPEYLLVRHLGEGAVKRQAVEQLLHRTLPEALDSVAGRALKESEHIAQKADDLINAFAPSAPFKYEVTVDVVPEVTWASERAYAELSVEVEVEEESKESEAVEGSIRSRVKDLGSLRVSPTAAVKMGDLAIVDVSAFRITTDGGIGDPILSATKKGFQVDTELSTQGILPGFVDSLLGLERGQTREFDLVFPHDWQQESLRNVGARFQVVCQELFERQLPIVDDEMADKFIPGANTMDEVRERLSAQWREDREQKKRQATMLALLGALAKVCTIEIPNSLLEEQGRQMYGAKLIELQAGGKLSKEDTVQLMSEQMVNNYLLSQKDKIELQVKQALAVQEVFRLENLSFTDAELAAEIESAEAEFKAYSQEYDQKRVQEQAAELLEGAKVLEWLTQQSTIKYISV